MIDKAGGLGARPAPSPGPSEEDRQGISSASTGVVAANPVLSTTTDQIEAAPPKEAHAGSKVPVATTNPAAGLFALRADKPFSKPPGELGPMLHDEVKRACKFVDELIFGLTFFGGARVAEDDPVFELGKHWGEGVFLANVLSKDEVLGTQAIASGLFSAEAVSAAKGAALGVAAGVYGADSLNQALIAGGGVSGDDALASALAHLAGRSVDPKNAKLIAGLEARPRTGAGPGMMHAVPLGYVSARDKLLKLFPDAAKAIVADLEAQGSRMAGKLPDEQKESDAIEKMGYFKHFISRRLALTEGTAGFVVFPGGIGTLNELFEVMREDRPVLFDGKEFWGGITDVMVQQWKARGLVAEADLDCFRVEDGVQDGLPWLLERATSGRVDSDTLAKKGADVGVELERGLKTLSALKPAVTFVGGRLLKGRDPEVAIAAQIAERITQQGVPARIGGDGALLNAVHRGVRKSDADAPIQALLFDHGDLDQTDTKAKAEIHEVVHSAIAHKLLMYENTEAIVALPGGKGTFDEVFEVLCLISTGNLPQRPLICVGKDFWKPLIDACKDAMTVPGRALVREGYLDKFIQVVDSADEAMALIDAHRAKSEETA